MSYPRSAEHRRQQSRRIHEWRPWEHSTGPRSRDGKARASRNAYKGGGQAVVLQTLRRMLREQERARRTLVRGPAAGGR